jgi:hypothetical protein
MFSLLTFLTLGHAHASTPVGLWHMETLSIAGAEAAQAPAAEQGRLVAIVSAGADGTFDFAFAEQGWGKAAFSGPALPVAHVSGVRPDDGNPNHVAIEVPLTGGRSRVLTL